MSDKKMTDKSMTDKPDEPGTWLNVRIPEPIKWAGMIWIGYMLANLLLMSLGYLNE